MCTSPTFADSTWGKMLVIACYETILSQHAQKCTTKHYLITVLPRPLCRDTWLPRDQYTSTPLVDNAMYRLFTGRPVLHVNIIMKTAGAAARFLLTRRFHSECVVPTLTVLVWQSPELCCSTRSILRMICR